MNNFSHTYVFNVSAMEKLCKELRAKGASDATCVVMGMEVCRSQDPTMETVMMNSKVRINAVTAGVFNHERVL